MDMTDDPTCFTLESPIEGTEIDPSSLIKSSINRGCMYPAFTEIMKVQHERPYVETSLHFK